MALQATAALAAQGRAPPKAFLFFLSVCLSLCLSLSLSLSERQANVLVYTCFYYIHILHKSKEVLKDSCVLCPLFAPA